MEKVLKLLILLTVSLLLVSGISFIYACVSGPFLNGIDVEPESITKSEEGVYIFVFEMPNISSDNINKLDASFNAWVPNTAKAYFLSNDKEECLRIETYLNSTSRDVTLEDGTYYFFDATEAIKESYLMKKEKALFVLKPSDEEDLIEIYNNLHPLWKPELTIKYWKRSSHIAIDIVNIFLLLSIFSIIVTIIHAVVIRSSKKQSQQKSKIKGRRK